VLPSEYKAAAACLAEAFANDEVVRYPIDTPDRVHWTEDKRYDLHLQALEYITYAHCVKGLVTTIGEDYGSVALWMPPGKNMDDWFTMLRSGMWRLNFQLSSEGKKRFFEEFLPLLHTTKEEVMGERDAESWYLVYIGTKTASRGKGYARKLIEHITERVSNSSLLA
jgi:ribosomal protein S18 acetylase RimI-like enzyme